MIIQDLEHLEMMPQPTNYPFSQIQGGSFIIQNPVVEIKGLLNGMQDAVQATAFPTTVRMSLFGNVEAGGSVLFRTFEGIKIRAISPSFGLI